MFNEKIDAAPSNKARITVGIISLLLVFPFGIALFFLTKVIFIDGINDAVAYVLFLIAILLFILFTTSAYRLLFDYKSNKRIFNPYILCMICTFLFVGSTVMVLYLLIDSPQDTITNRHGRYPPIIAPLLFGWMTYKSFKMLKNK